MAHRVHGAGVRPDVLLQHEDVGELLVAYWTLMHHPECRLGSVDTHVSLEVPFGCEGASAYLALEGSFPGVDSVMHLKR